MCKVVRWLFLPIIIVLHACTIVTDTQDSIEGKVQQRFVLAKSQDPHHAYETAQKALELAIANELTHQLPEAYTTVGAYALQCNRIEEAVPLFMEALNHNPSIRQLSATYQQMGLAYASIGSYHSAGDYYLKSLFGYKFLNDTASIAHCYALLGGAMTHAEEYALAEENLQKAQAFNRVGNQQLAILTLHHFTQLYLQQQQPGKASGYLQQLQHLQPTGADWLDFLLQSALLATQQGKVAEAQGLYQQVLAIVGNQPVSTHFWQAHQSYANFLVAQGLQLQAIELIENALVRGQGQKATFNDLGPLYRELHYQYEMAGNLNQSMVYIKKYNALADGHLAVLEQANALFKQAAIQAAARKVEEEELFKRNNTDKASMPFNKGWTFLIIFVGLVAISIALIYYRLRRSRIHSAVFQAK